MWSTVIQYVKAEYNENNLRQDTDYTVSGTDVSRISNNKYEFSAGKDITIEFSGKPATVKVGDSEYTVTDNKVTISGQNNDFTVTVTYGWFDYYAYYEEFENENGLKMYDPSETKDLKTKTINIQFKKQSVQPKVSIRTNIMAITAENDWWEKSSKLSKNINVYNTKNESCARNTEQGKKGSAVGNVGDFVYIEVYVKMVNTPEDDVKVELKYDFRYAPRNVNVQVWKKTRRGLEKL